MTFTQDRLNAKPLSWSPRSDLPTMYDLPSEFPEEPGLPDIYHDLQPEFLSSTLMLKNYAVNEYFTGSDLNVYYDSDNKLWHKRPDWFLAVGVPSLYDGHDMRLSYVTWQEPANPFVIVELISPGTEDEDFGRTVARPGGPPTKWTVYEQILQVPYYLVFNRYSDQLRVFKLESGQYQEQLSADDRLWIPELNLGLGLWYGTYKAGTHQETERLWLRWYNEDGQWSPTSEERANQRAEVERERAEVERERAEVERERAEIERERAAAERQRASSAEAELEVLKERLRQRGIDPDELL